jgi:hypothetical protein
LHLLEDAIPEGEHQPHGIRDDAWFGSVRTASEVGFHGHEGVFQVKQYSALYPKDFITKALEDAPGGVSIVLEGTAPNGISLIALGYRYSHKTTLCFVMTTKAGRTMPGNLYVMQYTDGFGNLCTRDVERPDVISTFFKDSSIIDTHNQCQQCNLALENKWLTKDAYFRLTTIHIGINVVDSYKLSDFHQILNFTKKLLRKR